VTVAAFVLLVACHGGPEPCWLDERCDVIELEIVYHTYTDNGWLGTGKPITSVMYRRYNLLEYHPTLHTYYVVGYVSKDDATLSVCRGRPVLSYHTAWRMLVRVKATSYQERIIEYDDARDMPKKSMLRLPRRY